MNSFLILIKFKFGNIKSYKIRNYCILKIIDKKYMIKVLYEDTRRPKPKLPQTSKE